MAASAGFYLPGPAGTFDSTEATASPWDVTQQHGGPPSALLARAIEACQPRPDMAVSRISVDFLGGIPQGRMTVRAKVLRGGRRIELVEADLIADGRTVAGARARRSQVGAGAAVSVPSRGAIPPPLPEPQPPRYFTGVAPDWGYGRAIEWRFVSGSYFEEGPAVVWARSRLVLVGGCSSTPPPSSTLGGWGWPTPGSVTQMAISVWSPSRCWCSDAPRRRADCS